MADTWTLNKKCEDLEEAVEQLQEIAHPPIFTQEMIDSLFKRIEILEDALGMNEDKKPAKSKKKKASA
tara:strand:- start:769 stop:972 length:204 start_codon:yes stop_codon:yes gene_type:complete